MKAYSLDLRERVLAAVDAKEGTWKEIAARFRVSVPWINRMARQRRELGTLEVQTHRCGRKRLLTEEHHQQLAQLVAEDSDATLKELRERLGVTCCLEVIWDALNRLGLTYKKNRPGPRNKIAPTSKSSVRTGNTSSRTWSRNASFSLMKPPPRRT